MADVLIKGIRRGATFMQEAEILDIIGRGDNPVIKLNGVYFVVTANEQGWRYTALERKPETTTEETST